MTLLDQWPWLLVSAMPPLMMLKSYRQMNNMVEGYGSRYDVKVERHLKNFYASSKVRIRAFLLLAGSEGMFAAFHFSNFSVTPLMFSIYATCLILMIIGVCLLWQSYQSLYDEIRASSKTPEAESPLWEAIHRSLFRR